MINCLDGRFRITNGRANTSALLFDTSRVTIAGLGNVDLATETLDFKLMRQPKKARLVSLAVPINVRGTLASPRAAPDSDRYPSEGSGGPLGSIGKGINKGLKSLFGL